MPNKKMLFITRVVPSLNGTGAQRRCARHIVALHSLFSINLVILRRESNKVELDHIIINLCHSSTIQHITDFQQQQQRIFSLPFAPPIHAMCPTKQEINIIVSTINRFSPEQLFAFKLSTARILENSTVSFLVKPLKKTFDLDDIESKAKYRFALASKKKMGLRLLFCGLLEAFKLKCIEYRAFTNFDNTLICSNTDQKELQKRNTETNFVIIPNVVDEVKELIYERVDNQIRLLFVGTMQYGPNNQAAVHFVNNIFPILLKLTKKVIILDIVGYHPTDEVIGFAKNSQINVHGGVNSVEPYYQKSDIVIAPILAGGGTRIKILEAMMYARPVVSTTIGAEGLNLVNRKEILLADTPTSFAQAIIELSEKQIFANDICKNAAIKLNMLYTKKALNNIYVQLYNKVNTP
jgi:glycosyltransferase involved in cell wall biosynthesis